MRWRQRRCCTQPFNSFSLNVVTSCEFLLRVNEQGVFVVVRTRPQGGIALEAPKTPSSRTVVIPVSAQTGQGRSEASECIVNSAVGRVKNHPADQ